MQNQNYTDETLVMLTLAGDQSAYEKLVIRYQNAVIASAVQITHSRFMAEDAAQDAFVTAWMKLNTLKQPDKFCAWVCRIAKKLCAEHGHAISRLHRLRSGGKHRDNRRFPHESR